MKNMKSYSAGFIKTRFLIALLITLSILPLCTSMVRLLGNVNMDYDLVNSELSMMDLRRILLIAYDLEINEYELNFTYHNSPYNLRLINDKLILSPGTQIYLNDIKEASFYTKNGCLYLRYVNNDNKEYEKIIGSAKSFHLPEFSNNYDDGTRDDYDLY